MPFEPLGAPWDELKPEHVTAAMSAQAEEPLLLEAKGGGLRIPPEGMRRRVTKQVSGFANSERGGYLVLGFGQADGKSEREGWAFPDEPRVWITNVIQSTIDPAPAVDVQAWELPGTGRYLAVVKVAPASVPPCITIRGEIFTRLPGKTEPVKSTSELQRLFEKGERARSFAWSQSREGRDDLNHQESPDGRGRYHGAIVSIGCPSFERDMAVLVPHPRADGLLVPAPLFGGQGCVRT